MQWFSVILLYYAIIFIIPLRLSDLNYSSAHQQKMILFSNVFEVIVITSLIFLLYRHYMYPNQYYRIIYSLIFACLVISLLLEYTHTPSSSQKQQSF